FLDSCSLETQPSDTPPRQSHCSERDHDDIAAEPVYDAAPGLTCESGEAVETSLEAE
ncbi:hypothetical protein MTO96_050082, partial [Rhipicephalus appendiculatus]